MSQHASSSSHTITSQLLDRGDRDYTMPAGFATAAVQAAIAVVKQFKKGEISKTEAILDIQAALTSGENEPSNEELISALSSYVHQHPGQHPAVFWRESVQGSSIFQLSSKSP